MAPACLSSSVQSWAPSRKQSVCSLFCCCLVALQFVVCCLLASSVQFLGIGQQSGQPGSKLPIASNMDVGRHVCTTTHNNCKRNYCDEIDCVLLCTHCPLPIGLVVHVGWTLECTCTQRIMCIHIVIIASSCISVVIPLCAASTWRPAVVMLCAMLSCRPVVHRASRAPNACVECAQQNQECGVARVHSI